MYRPRAEREESALPWLEIAGPKEVSGHRGEARVLEKLVGKFDSKERNPNKEKSGQKLSRKTTKKSLPNPNPMKSFTVEHQPLPNLTRRKKKKSKALMAGGHKNSTGYSQGGAKTFPTLEGRGGKYHRGGVEPPSLNTQQNCF